MATGLAVMLTAGLGVGLSWGGGRSEADVERPVGPQVRSIAVVRTDLSDTRQMDGTLGFGASWAINGTGDGIVTWLPAVGATVKRGQQLLRIDDQPTVLLYGGTPLFRRLDTRGAVGRDVRVVADNLTALGYNIGSQPAPGTTVRPQTTPAENPTTGKSGAQKDDPDNSEPAAQPSASPRPVKVKSGDGVLTSSLIAAIKRWQPTVGLDPTGVLDITDVAVEKGAIRVSQLTARPGVQASGELMTVTATTQTVTVPVDVLDIGSIKRDQRVTVTMPDETTIPGRVSTIGTAIRGGDTADNGDGPPQRTVLIRFAKKDAPRTVNAAKVQVSFPAKARKDVLAVPVEALLALREGGYGVQVTGGRLVAVETGLFAMGLVEISGSGIDEGTKVTTTS